MTEVGSPRNTIIGHVVGVAAGAASLALFGLLNAPSVYVSGVTLDRVFAIALAVALTGGVLRVLRAARPPRVRDDHRRLRSPGQAAPDA